MCLSLSLSFFGPGQVSSSLWSIISKVTSVSDRSLKGLLNYICLCHYLCLCMCLCHCLFFGSGHVSSSLWSNVSKVWRLWGCSLKVLSKCLCLCLCHCLFLVSSCLFITLIKCLKGHRSLGLLFVCQSVKYRESMSQSVTQWQGHLLSCSGQLKNSTSTM